MQYKTNTKIIIDKRKLDTLVRLGCPADRIVSVITTGSFDRTGDELIDDNLESLIDIRQFDNWGGKRQGAGRPLKNKENNQDDNQLGNQDDNQVGNQDDNQVVDIDKDNNKIKGKGCGENPLREEEYECISEALDKWIAYKKERNQSYKPTGLKVCAKKLKELSNNSQELAMRIVDESISNNWSGLFPLKDTAPVVEPEPAKNVEEKMIYIDEGMFYIDDTMPQYRQVIDDLDPTIRDGICERVYNWLIQNRRCDMVSEQFIIERLIQFRPFPKKNKKNA